MEQSIITLKGHKIKEWVMRDRNSEFKRRSMVVRGEFGRDRTVPISKVAKRYLFYDIIIPKRRVQIVPDFEAPLIVLYRVKQEFPEFDCLPE
jgi:hypothetical protein